MGVSTISDTRLFTANTQLAQGILRANQTYSLIKSPIYTHTRSKQLVTPHRSKRTITEQIVRSQTAEDTAAKHTKCWRIMWWSDHGLVDPVCTCYVFLIIQKCIQ